MDKLSQDHASVADIILYAAGFVRKRGAIKEVEFIINFQSVRLLFEYMLSLLNLSTSLADRESLAKFLIEHTEGKVLIVLILDFL